MAEQNNIQKIEEINAIISEIQNKINRGEYQTGILSEFVKPVKYLHVALPYLNVYLTPIKTGVDGHFFHKDYKDFKAPYILIHNNVFKRNKVVLDEHSIAHELQHYFDWRDGIPRTPVKSILKPEGGISSEYYNNPDEKRAYTIQFLRQYFQQVKLKRMPDNFVDFYKDFFKKISDARKYYQYISSENRNDFDKYLQDFHQKLLERKHNELI